MSVTIRASTEPGKHKLICRVHKYDGEPTSAKFELEINVVVSATSG